MCEIDFERKLCYQIHADDITSLKNESRKSKSQKRNKKKSKQFGVAGKPYSNFSGHFSGHFT